MSKTTKPTVRVSLDLKPIDKLLKGLRGERLKPLLNKWVTRYASFVRAEFNKNSRGGGDWPPLAESTIRARSRKKASRIQVEKSKDGKTVKVSPASVNRKFAILKDHGVLFNAIGIGALGNLTEYKDTSVVFGFANVKHPFAKTTIQQIATFHDLGGKHLPKRTILREPTKEIIDYMLDTARRHVDAITRA